MTQEASTRQGVLLALAAYTMWGIAPIYFRALEQVPALEVVSHRIIWSLILLIVLISCGRNWGYIRQLLRQPKQMAILFVSACIIGVNWLVFIWAVNHGHMIDASLGYFINPLVNVVLGMLFLGERLRPWQWGAVALAATGVSLELYQFGSLPWVALVLACSFGIYGLLRKKVNLGAQSGLFIETLVLFPVALGYLALFANSPTSDLSQNSWTLNLLLLSAGLITMLPLLCFTAAATRLPLSTLGFFQYIGPSLMFMLAILVYNEPFSLSKGFTFVFIWAALLVFSLDALRQHKRMRKAKRALSQ
ncbi:Protein RarD [Vibrio stylophorae]|uniref:Protein RarD n=1 Tax=Vibrio stylophorae TaxID=659351 RepID=A0ABN8DS93_9VIBR|nr:EamA family transporter RarD [Vibrio stylophorae]CAH0532287.1 Protein RarD [Vibrio stylophorae]